VYEASSVVQLQRKESDTAHGDVAFLDYGAIRVAATGGLLRHLR
jgi:hypothetical protein